MDFGIALASNLDAWKTVKHAEELGISHAWFYDSQMLAPDIFATMALAAEHTSKIKLGLASKLPLGNLEAKRDWGHAQDYVQAMWLMLQQEEPSDYVVATGQMHSVREFADAAFRHVGLDYREFVETDPRFLRPADVELLLGDASRARAILGWKPSCHFQDLVHEMVDSDLQRLKTPGA